MKTESNIFRLAAFIVSAALLLSSVSGCRPKADRYSDGSGTASSDVRLTVYADEQYRLSLERAIYRISRAHPEWKIAFADKDADIVITDRFNDERCRASADLSRFAEERAEIFVPQLIYKSGDSVKGLPLFLKLQCLWYDTLYAKMRSTEIPNTLRGLLAMQGSDNNLIALRSDDVSALFWSVTAPYYISGGGSVGELESGRLDSEKIGYAASKTLEIINKTVFRASEEAMLQFKSEQSLFCIADAADISAERHNMPINSSLFFSPYVLFDSFENIPVILRAAYVSISAKTDAEYANAFLDELYKNETLVNMLKYTEIPLACRIDYGDTSIPKLISHINNILSSPGLALCYVNCRWDDLKTENAAAAMNGLINGSMGINEIKEIFSK